MRVAIVHDDLVQWGGAERVLLGISELFPDAPIYTCLFDRSNHNLEKNFGHRKVVTSFLQKTPGWKNFYKALLPLYPIAFELFDFTQYDLVISQTTRFAKSIITKPETKHVCYCHTPPRFLWNFSGEEVPKISKPLMSYLRFYDQISSKRVDQWIAGSANAKKRIERVYHQTSEVCYPFIELKQTPDPFDGGYYLIISRLNSYKRVDIAIEAFNELGWNLKIVGVGPQLRNLAMKAGGNIDFLGSVNDEVLSNLIAGCKALIVTAEEDFGLTSLEAQALGKPVIAYGVGGSQETVVENRTGVYFNKQSAQSLGAALKKIDRIKIDPKLCKENAQRFSKRDFQKKFLEFVNI